MQAERERKCENTIQTGIDHMAAREEDLLPAPSRDRIEKIKAVTDPGDAQTVLQFGAEAQSNMAAFSDYILKQVKETKQADAAAPLSELAELIKEMEEEKNAAAWLPFLNRKSRNRKKNLQKYKQLEVRLDRIEHRLELVRIQLLKEITLFEEMYEKNLEYYQNLEEWIVAGEETIREAEETMSGKRRRAGEEGQPLALQQLHNYEEGLWQLEQKLYDLKISRTISLQTVPQIHLIQKQKKLLADKIQTALFGTIPLWKNQIALALAAIPD